MSSERYRGLGYCDPSDIYNRMEELQHMADDLAALGWADDAAGATQDLLIDVRIMYNRINRGLQKLQPVWYAMDRMLTGDGGEDQVMGRVLKLRGVACSHLNMRTGEPARTYTRAGGEEVCAQCGEEVTTS